MIPIFKITANGEDITTLIKDRFVSLSIKDKLADNADELTLTIDDRDELMQFPVIKKDEDTNATELHVWLGYADTELTDYGTFFVDEVSIADHPKTMTIAAKAVDITGALKTQKNKTWENVTLGDMVSSIASTSGFRANVSADIETLPIAHAMQSEQSDMDFLHDQAKKLNVVFKPMNKTLTVTPINENKTIDGEELAVIELQRNDLSSLSAKITSADIYTKVTASYYDTAAAEEATVSRGADGVDKLLERVYGSADEAGQAAEASLAVVAKRGAEISVSLAARADIFAGCRVSVNGIRAGLPIIYDVGEVSVSYSPSAFSMSFSAVSKK